jgi:alkanesulfonate monooxygenase SsuD/methylene tetrahydromethanopterin reductase-like flavin-dependent oxidoreductase (luciferase family)
MSPSAPTPECPAHPWVSEGQNRVRFGIYGGPGSDWDAARSWARTVEELGFDSYWVGDHPVEFPFDCFTRLSAIATITERVRLGTLVTCAHYRHALMLARQAADVDRVSGGRLVLGLGIGDAPREFAQLGLNYGKTGERQELLEEMLQVLPTLWTGESVTFEGRHVRLADAKVLPGPVQRPWVPIMVAGGGERVTLRQVAQYADASNTGPGNLIGNAWGPEEMRRKHEVLRRHCEEMGRPLESILRTHVNFMLKLGKKETTSVVRDRAVAFDFDFDRFVGTPEDAIAYYRALVEVGARYFITSVANTQTLKLLAEEVMPEVVRL